jgi:hypothetical protein
MTTYVSKRRDVTDAPGAVHYGTVALFTNDDHVVLGAIFNGEPAAVAMFTDRDTVRGIGTTLLAWVGAHAFSLWGTHVWTDNASPTVELFLDVQDGLPAIDVGKSVHHALEPDDAIDLGVRLIVWAGVPS